MALNIKNKEAEDLARDLARETHTTITDAVVTALKQAMLRLRGRRSGPSRRDAILEVADRCTALPDIDTRNPDEILEYDKHGGFSG